MAGVPAVLLDVVTDQPTQTGVSAVRPRRMDQLVEAAVSQGRGQARPGSARRRRRRPRRAARGCRRGRRELPVVGAVPAPGVPRRAERLTRELGGEGVVLLCGEMLEQPADAKVDRPMVVCIPAASRPSAFQRKVARNRSSAPTSCSTSVPARGGFPRREGHRGVVVVIRATVDPVPDVPLPGARAPRQRSPTRHHARVAPEPRPPPPGHAVERSGVGILALRMPPAACHAAGGYRLAELGALAALSAEQPRQPSDGSDPRVRPVRRRLRTGTRRGLVVDDDDGATRSSQSGTVRRAASSICTRGGSGGSPS